MNGIVLQVELKNGVIEFNNYEEIKADIAEKMAEYKGAVYSDESIPIAKKELASLRNDLKAAEDRRKLVKEEHMKSYNEFETKFKEITALIKEPIELIGGQVKDYVEREKVKKRELIKDLYKEIFEEAAEFVPLEKIYDSRWENKTCKKSEIEVDLKEHATSVMQSIVTLQSMNSEAYEKAIVTYKNTLNLAESMQVITTYETQRAEILKREQEKRREEELRSVREEERRRIAEEARIREEERHKALAEIEEQKKKELEEMAVSEESAGELLDMMLRLKARKSEVDQIIMYLDSIGVEYTVSEYTGF